MGEEVGHGPRRVQGHPEQLGQPGLDEDPAPGDRHERPEEAAEEPQTQTGAQVERALGRWSVRSAAQQHAEGGQRHDEEEHAHLDRGARPGQEVDAAAAQPERRYFQEER